MCADEFLSMSRLKLTQPESFVLFYRHPFYPLYMKYITHIINCILSLFNINLKDLYLSFSFCRMIVAADLQQTHCIQFISYLLHPCTFLKYIGKHRRLNLNILWSILVFCFLRHLNSYGCHCCVDLFWFLLQLIAIIYDGWLLISNSLTVRFLYVYKYYY